MGMMRCFQYPQLNRAPRWRQIRAAFALTVGARNATITNWPAGKMSTVGRVAQLAEQLTLNQ